MPVPTATIHDNTAAAGRRTGDTVRVTLTPIRAMWYPETENDPGALVWAFAADSGTPMIPGPMLRASERGVFEVTVVNPDPARALTIRGLGARPLALTDSLLVPAGDSTTVTFAAGEPGSYFYTATWHADDDSLPPDEMLLAGALVVDADTATPPDRVFLISSWFTKVDSTRGPPFVTTDWLVINGRSFPDNGTINITQGDTVRWRWINPSRDAHPIHLHGEFFRVTRRGTWAADSASWGQEVVTQLIRPGETFESEYVAHEPGNWVVHCHFAFHTSHFLSADRIPEPTDPGSVDAVDHSVMGMRGMMLRIAVAPRDGLPRRAADSAGTRAIRLVVRAALGMHDPAPDTSLSAGYTEGLAFMKADDGDPPRDSVPAESAMLVLTRGVPVAITVVNQMRAPTAVHWHGMEVPSWSDGIPGLSGGLPKVAPLIMPGDSFVARFTPTRSGTYMYHAHSNELHQIASGLAGALLVVDPASYHPRTERLVTITGDGYLGTGARINGSRHPEALTIPAGVPIRFRLISITADWSITAQLVQDSIAVPWTMVAKDAADLPRAHQVNDTRPWRAGPGESADFLVRITTPGAYAIRVVGNGTDWTTVLPITVVPR